MAWIDNCKFTPTLGGTTDWTYSAAVSGYQSPAAAGVTNGATYNYFAITSDLTQWEIGKGAYNTSTGVLTRATVMYNSAGTGTATGQTGAGTKISFSTVPAVAIIATAEDLIQASLVISDTAPASTAATLWWRSTDGALFVNYNDGNSTQWVAAGTVATLPGTVQYDVAQSLSSTQQNQAQKNVGLPTIMRGSLAQGCTLSAAGATATFGVSAGCWSDSTYVDSMLLASAFTKTTAAWAAGTGNGALDTGAISTSSWYWVFLIKNPTSGAVDVLVTKAVAATTPVPTLPSGYTLYRYIGSMKTDGSSQWVKFSQNDDEFLWDVAVNNVNTSPASTAIQTATVTTPLGVKTTAILTLSGQGGAGSDGRGWIFSPDVNSPGTLAIGSTTINFGESGNTAQMWAPYLIRTNASAQVKYVMVVASGIPAITTVGWIDTRGRLD